MQSILVLSRISNLSRIKFMYLLPGFFSNKKLIKGVMKSTSFPNKRFLLSYLKKTIKKNFPKRNSIHFGVMFVVWTFSEIWTQFLFCGFCLAQMPLLHKFQLERLCGILKCFITNVWNRCRCHSIRWRMRAGSCSIGLWIRQSIHQNMNGSWNVRDSAVFSEQNLKSKIWKPKP